MNLELDSEKIKIASGKKPADLVIKNVKIVNVFTKEIIKNNVAIYKDFIIGIGNYKGINEIDAEGKFICPGLIDSHVHIESSMVSPVEFANSILPHGTTTIIADPHEIANVCGENGIKFMINQSKNTLLNIFFMLPSCVPATPFENNGSIFDSSKMKYFISNKNILGLAEVMDYVSVINCNEEILKKINLFKNSTIDGHCPSLSGKSLNAYKISGVSTDHECSTIEEVAEKLRIGMYIQIREGSAAKNLTNIISEMIKINLPFNKCLFCTDDRQLADIIQNGHINYNIKKSISLGLNPIEAISMATINTANCYNLKNIGAIAPGYIADFLLLNDLDSFDIDKVYLKGKILKENNENNYTLNITKNELSILNTVNIPKITKEKLKITINNDLANVIDLIPGSLITKKNLCSVKKINNIFIADKTFSKLVVIERHKALNKIGLGILKNFNIQSGAIASTIAHDSHNLIVVGDNDDDILLAINKIKQINGGLVIVGNNKVLGSLALPIAGIMSTESANIVESNLKKLNEISIELKINPQIDPFTLLSFLALPVIPEIRLTDQGLFDVINYKFISI
ncbi:MAG: adenine deaminase [Clostridiales bacterium]